MLGKDVLTGELKQQAARLKQEFLANFWIPKLKTYALALDGKKRPCEVKSSNAGHSLFTEIADARHAKQISKLFLSDEFYSGWGIRTVASGEARYNPMSYHNGSIWPHDNALIAHGFGRYGDKRAVLQVLRSLFDLSYFIENHRLPELFCGFPRRSDEGPTNYPVACSPQSWSAGAVFLLIQSALGLTIDATKHELCFDQPVLPDFMQDLRILNLKVGKAMVDLSFERHEHTVGINVLRKRGKLRVIGIK
jgi:glycogen debranching enzyme